MKLGCHAVLFKKRIAEETDYILKGLSETGFDGFELGARFFGAERKQELISKLLKYNLELSGLHVGGSLSGWVEKEQEMHKSLMAAAGFVKDLPSKNVILSGGVLKDENTLVQIAQNIEKTAKACLDMGVTVNYHNHLHEFENGAKIFKTLFEYAPSLNYAMDLGWVFAGGCNPIEYLEKYGARISYVHLRDLDKNSTPNKDFVDLGSGSFDYPKLMSVLKSVLGDDGWAVVEYEEGEQDFTRYTKAKQFLDSVL